MLEHKDEKIEKAYKVLHYLSSDPDTVRLAELREKAVWDEVSRMDGALNEGLQKGLKQGIEQMVLSMLANGISVADVAKIAGLTEAEVRSMKH